MSGPERAASVPDVPPNPKELGFYVSLAQVGLEMVAPIGLGLVLDHYFGWTPWGIIAGAILGLVGGFAHLVALLNRQNEPDAAKRKRDMT